MHTSRGERPSNVRAGAEPRGCSCFFNVWDPGKHPKKRQQLEGGAAGRHERCPELDAGGRRAGRQHCRPKVSSDWGFGGGGGGGEAGPQAGLLLLQTRRCSW